MSITSALGYATTGFIFSDIPFIGKPISCLFYFIAGVTGIGPAIKAIKNCFAKIKTSGPRTI